MDRAPQNWEGRQEGKAREQGPVHLEDVPPRRLRHSGSEEPSGGGRALNPLLPALTTLRMSVSVLNVR